MASQFFLHHVSGQRRSAAFEQTAAGWRRVCGASLSEFLVIASVVVSMAILGATLFGGTLLSQTSKVGTELSGGNGGSNIDTAEGILQIRGDGSPIASDLDAASDSDPGLLATAADKAVDFGKGFLAGLWSQVTDIWNIFRHPVEFGKQIIDLGIALATDPVDVLTAILEDLGQDAEAIFNGDTYAAGRVLGENVNPAVIARALSKLADFGGLARVTPTGRLPCASFVAGTQVWTPQGLQPIEALRVGGVVESRNDESYRHRSQLVEHTFGRHAPRYLVFGIGDELIGVTAEHPFWVQGKGWVRAAEIDVGTPVATATGEALVGSIDDIEGPVAVYNFTVAGDSTYFAGAIGLWVHNAGPCNVPENKFWTSSTTFQGNKVLQRNDLIDPKLVDGRGRTNVQRMKKGLAPIGPDGKSLNLHHMTQRPDGAIAEITQSMHKSNHGVIHINPSSVPSGIDRAAFNKWRSNYWKSRANDF